MTQNKFNKLAAPIWAEMTAATSDKERRKVLKKYGFVYSKSKSMFDTRVYTNIENKLLFKTGCMTVSRFVPDRAVPFLNNGNSFLQPLVDITPAARGKAYQIAKKENFNDQKWGCDFAMRNIGMLGRRAVIYDW